MTIAIMQPYLFPYIGYFQLLAAVDKFVIYDDVQYTKQGWINRNRLLIGGQPFLFTIVLDKPSIHSNINATKLSDNIARRSKILETIKQGYRRSSQFEQVFKLIEQIILNKDAQTIADLVRISLTEIMAYLEIKTELVPSSSIYNNQHLHGQERVLDICRQEGATNYINAQGGRPIYSHQLFKQAQVGLKFLDPNLVKYSQPGNKNFVAGLSIIDVLMNNSIDECNELIREYSLND